MSGLKQKSVQCRASIPDSGYVRPPPAGPLTFRSRDAANDSRNRPQEHRVKWQDKDASRQLYQVAEGGSFSCNENVKSWLSSTSPTSVIDQAQAEKDPPTPSPICSPSPPSPVVSPRHHLIASTSETPSLEFETAKVVNSGEDLASRRKKFEKNIALQNIDALPDSPTGSSTSSVSEGGLLALLASKLFSYREHSRPSSRYSRERSGPIDDKHVMEDRASKPPVEELHLEDPPQHERAQSDNHLLRTSSEATSELLFGSADDRTLSMEFDALLAAAVAAGVSNAMDTEGRSAVTVQEPIQREQLPDIQEDSSPRSAHRDDSDPAGVGSTDDGRGTEIGSAAFAPISLSATQRDDDIVHSISDSVTELPLSSRSSSRGSRRIESEQADNCPVFLASSSGNSSRGSTHYSGDSENGSNLNRLALVVVEDRSFDANSIISPSSSESSSKENISPNSGPNSGRKILEKVRRDKILAQAAAYQNAKNSKYDNRYKREEVKINAWENQQRIKAAVNMKKVEMKLEERRAKALEKMQNDIALAHKKAEERKASAEAVRGMKTAKVVVLTDSMRRTGKVSTGCFPF